MTWLESFNVASGVASFVGCVISALALREVSALKKRMRGREELRHAKSAVARALANIAEHEKARNGSAMVNELAGVLGPLATIKLLWKGKDKSAITDFEAQFATCRAMPSDGTIRRAVLALIEVDSHVTTDLQKTYLE